MFTELATAITTLESIVASFEPGCLESGDARRVCEQFARAERLCATGKTLAAGRVDDTLGWATAGDRSMADYLARICGTSTGDAIAVTATARALGELPATGQALRTGQLSAAQAQVIVDAAHHAPASEARLLDSARRNGMAGLKADAQRVKLAAQDPQERRQRQLGNRSLRRWTDSDGMRCGHYRLPELEGIALDQAIDAAKTIIFDSARKTGVRGTDEQYAADALTTLTPKANTNTDCSEPASETQSPAPVVVHKITVNGHVDYPALIRGYALDGELCEIPGAGPVPVAVLQQYLADGALFNLIIKNGVDVTTIVRAGRYVPEPLAIALAARDRECPTIGCHRARRLEHHHHDPIANGGPTSLANIHKPCEQCHDLISYHGYQYGPADQHGKRPLNPPEHPPDPPPHARPDG